MSNYLMLLDFYAFGPQILCEIAVPVENFL